MDFGDGTTLFNRNLVVKYTLFNRNMELESTLFEL